MPPGAAECLVTLVPRVLACDTRWGSDRVGHREHRRRREQGGRRGNGRPSLAGFGDSCFPPSRPGRS
eukprot:4535504-Alexandrium_andersonii.AAC.1